MSEPLVDMPELERHVAGLVVAELGADHWVRRELPDAGDRVRDFDVVFADGHEEPLEVTTNFDTTVMAALSRTDGGILELQAKVQRYWMVSGAQTFTDTTGKEAPFDRRRISLILPPLIERLEQEGEVSLDVVGLAWPVDPSAPTHHRRAALELHALGVTGGGSIEVPAGEDPRISVHLGGGVSWGPDTVTTVVENIAALPDNVAKLEAHRDADRRHLFVVLAGRGSTDMAGWALQQFLDGDWIWDREPPLPELPDAITTIWAGNRTSGIYATPPGGWKRFGAARE